MRATAKFKARRKEKENIALNFSKCHLRGLNTGPLDLQSNALPTELR